MNEGWINDMGPRLEGRDRVLLAATSGTAASKIVGHLPTHRCFFLSGAAHTLKALMQSTALPTPLPFRLTTPLGSEVPPHLPSFKGNEWQRSRAPLRTLIGHWAR